MWFGTQPWNLSECVLLGTFSYETESSAAQQNAVPRGVPNGIFLLKRASFFNLSTYSYKMQNWVTNALKPSGAAKGCQYIHTDTQTHSSV